MAKYKRGDTVIIVEDHRVMFGAPVARVELLNGTVGRIRHVWKSSYNGQPSVYDVVVGKQDLYTYGERSLRKPSPLELLAMAAE